MKNVFKVAGVAAALALVGGSMYVMNNQKARTQIGKKMVKAMDGAEAMIAKKMNQKIVWKIPNYFFLRAKYA